MDESGLILDDLTDRGDRVVSGVMVHGHLLFLGLNLRRRREVNGALECLEAKVRAGLEGISRVLSNHSDSVGGGLTKCGAIVLGLTADGLNDLLEVLGAEVGGSKVLNEVVKDEQSELQAFGLTA